MWLAAWAGCTTEAGTTTEIGPRVEVSVPVVEVGEAPIGGSAMATVVVQNDGLQDTVLGWAPEEGPFTWIQHPELAVDASGAAVDPARLAGGRLPAGVSMPVDVLFTPTVGGPALGVARITTSGDGVGTFADPARPELVWVAAGAAPLGAATRPWPQWTRAEDLGFVTGPTSARPTFSNAGAAPYAITAVSLERCDPGFALSSALPLTIGPGASADVVLAVAVSGGVEAHCDAIAATDLGVALPFSVSVNAPNCQDDTAPEVAFVEPNTAVILSRTEPATVKVKVVDVDQPPSTLGCEIHSSLKRRVIATCALGTVGTVEVPIALDTVYDAPAIDVWTLVGTDDCGHATTASLPVMIDRGWPADDEDGDVFGPKSSPVDCDEGDRAVYPYAAELPDGQDNDCDGAVDEGTNVRDDDGDGRAEVEDCDDLDAAIYVGAPERANDKDDDCDGVVDNGTLFGDDDGDGFAERDGDCDDTLAERHPGAGELCGDGVDDDCDGQPDEAADCRDSFAATVIAPIVLSATAVGPGDTVVARVETRGAPVTVSWIASTGTLSAPDGPAVTWTAPAAPGVVSLLATVTPADGVATVLDADIAVLEVGPTVEVPTEALSGCASGGGAGGVAVLAALAALRRRRPR